MAVCCNPAESCSKNLPEQFRLHGVWPTNTDGTPLEKCTTVPFAFSAIKDIESDLKFYWPSYYREENKVLWKREWDIHGTCSKLSVAEYFQDSLALYKKMYQKILRALNQNGLKPSRNKDMALPEVPILENYYNAIVKTLNLTPMVSCKVCNGINYFTEMRLCATIDFKGFTNCSSSRNPYSGDCGNVSNTKALFFRTVP